MKLAGFIFLSLAAAVSAQFPQLTQEQEQCRDMMENFHSCAQSNLMQKMQNCNYTCGLDMVQISQRMQERQNNNGRPPMGMGPPPFGDQNGGPPPGPPPPFGMPPPPGRGPPFSDACHQCLESKENGLKMSDFQTQMHSAMQQAEQNCQQVCNGNSFPPARECAQCAMKSPQVQQIRTQVIGKLCPQAPSQSVTQLFQCDDKMPEPPMDMGPPPNGGF